MTFGQSSETLHHAGVDKVKVIACTIPDDVLKGTTKLRIVTAVRHLNPAAIIIANAVQLEDSKDLYEAGADYVFLQRVERARAVERAIEHALSGGIKDYRATLESRYGQ